MGKTKRRKKSFGGCWKVRFRCITSAQLAADRQNQERKRLGKIAHRMMCWKPYRCETCGQFHTGRKRSDVFFSYSGKLYRKHRRVTHGSARAQRVVY